MTTSKGRVNTEMAKWGEGERAKYRNDEMRKSNQINVIKNHITIGSGSVENVECRVPYVAALICDGEAL